MGFPLEGIDPLGRFRLNAGGHAVDATAELKSGEKIIGPGGLKKHILTQKDLFLKNLSAKLLSYALGRGLEFYDMYTVNQGVKAMRQSNYNFSALVKSIVFSYQFQYRRGTKK